VPTSFSCLSNNSTVLISWSKMDCLKLSGTIAVSSKGFSRSAKLKAQK
jgi:hypothetical protein